MSEDDASMSDDGAWQTRRPTFLSADSADKARQAEVDALGERVIDVLRTVYDPEIPVNIFELGLIYKVDIDDDRHVQHRHDADLARLPGRRHPARRGQGQGRERSRASAGATVEVVWDPPWHPGMMTEEAQLELGMI